MKNYEWQHLKKSPRDTSFEKKDFKLERYRFEGIMWKEELKERLSTQKFIEGKMQKD